MKKIIIAPLYYFYSKLKNPLPKKISLDGNYFIKEFDSSILDSVFDFFVRGYSEEEKDRLRNCRKAIYYKYNTTGDESEMPEEIRLNIVRIVQTLRIVRPNRIIYASIFNFRVKGRKLEPLQVHYKPEVNITHSFRNAYNQEFFNRNDSNKIKKYWKAVKYLYDNFSKKYHKVLNALFFFEIAHHTQLYKPKMIHYVTCLESLFNMSNTDVAYSLKIKGSYFTKKNPQERMEVARKISEIYSLRSTFVHGQGASASLLKNMAKQAELIEFAEDTSRLCLQKILNKKLIDVFGNIKQLVEEFKKLELGNKSLLS